jgi:hypothetical protein
MQIDYPDYCVDTGHLKKITDAALCLFKTTCTESEPYEVPNTRGQSKSEEWRTKR